MKFIFQSNVTMKLQEIKNMSCAECAKYCNFEFGYSDIDIARNDVIRKCNERGEFEPVIDDETIEILSALLPIANDLGIGEAWQNMLQEKSMRSLSVAADAANASDVAAAYMSNRGKQARCLHHAALEAYQAAWPRWWLNEQKHKQMLRKIAIVLLDLPQ